MLVILTVEVNSPTLRRARSEWVPKVHTTANANERVAAIEGDVFYMSCLTLVASKYADHYRIRGTLMV